MFTSTISRTIASVWTEGRGLRRRFLPLLVLLALIWPHPVAAQSPGETGLPPEADAVARTINGLRAQAGLPSLRVHPLLTQAAALHIQDMVTSGQYGHTGSDGSNVHQRVARTGYVVDGWAGEIWAAYGTVEQAFAMWMESPPHRESILNPSYQEMGVATGWHPNGRQLIIVVDFTTGSQNQAPGQALLPSPAAPVVADPPADGRYTVQPGDTLFTIGMRFGVDWQALAAANGLGESAILQIGQVLRLPGDPGPDPRPPAPTSSSYTVQAGDSLYTIALAHGLTWQELAAANGLNENAILHIGDQLRIPRSADSGPTARLYTVEAGDTIWSIAARHNVAWDALLAANGLAPDAILQIGQPLRIP